VTAETHFDRPILVTGFPRSGTSLVAGCLATCGAWIGETFAGDADNPKGYFENVRLREAVDKTVLRALSCDPLGVDPLPDLAAVPRRPAMRHAVLDAIRGEGYAGEAPWLFKDAKMSLLWPLWQAMFPDARWVIVERPAADMVASCLRTRFMAQHSADPAFWHGVIAAYRTRLEALRADASNSWSIVADAVVSGDDTTLRRLTEDLGLEWNAEALRTFVESKHWHPTKDTRA